MKLGTLCYVEKDKQYLMLHRNKREKDIHKNLWVGLGGKLKGGESPEECVIREVFEESGLKIQNPQLRGIITFPSDGIDEDWYVFLFTASSFSGKLIESCDEGNLAWIDKDKLNELPMHGGDSYFLKWIQENKGIFSASLIYENGVFKDYKIVVY